jgi:Ser/Thr protein kinase RdoA (MazF antagonist)
MADFIGDDLAAAELALEYYDTPPGSSLRLLNLSENATYAVEDTATGGRSILRVHRKNYHRRHEIESELDWLEALRRDSDVVVPEVLPAKDGRRVISVDYDGTERHVVHFANVPGAEPDPETLTVEDFHTLGRVTAALHDHSRTWERPAGFSRFAWDFEHCLGAQPRWGHWREADGVGVAEAQILDRAQQMLQRRLSDYGTGPQAFGLVHADLRLANLLVSDDPTRPPATPNTGSPSPARTSQPRPPAVTVIDFDDCGFGWYFYDFGTAVSFMEDDPALPEWQEAWTAGYRSRLSMGAEHENMLASFVLLRRLLLLAWMGSHRHSRESQSMSVTYAAGSCALAERYLTHDGLRLV